jgi:RNA polymerase sigma-70 factor, ECF subfamily
MLTAGAALTENPAMSSREREDPRDDADDPGNDSVPSTRWPALVRRVQAGEKGGLEDLYAVFSKGIRFFLCRQLGPQELDDKVHDTFLIVVEAILNGEVREPERLMGFVRTIVRRQIAAYIDAAVQSRREQAELDAGLVLADRNADPERDAISREKEGFMLQVLGELPPRDREILTRFYLREEAQEEICKEMHLTDTQFRLLKSRAKARFGELGRKRLQKRGLAKLFLRNISGVLH